MLNKLISLIFAVTLCTSSAIADSDNPQLLIQTNQGNITLELFQEQAPETVKNFLTYVDSGFYSGTIFHRTIAGFMIQGGGFTESLSRKETRAPIRNESGNGLSNSRGTISMARTNHPHSATSQFFINTVDNRNLDAQGSRFGYAVFGRVIQGMDIVMSISRAPTAPKAGHRDVPKQPIMISAIKRISEPSQSE
ncbi:peptidylprolyl isomerase [uncultured Neptuniibacter sp.]|uniref:peptidylprolyl isomerase n=1 Tax=uncultured Neptuniibacter sp. TaxID=502143 RepID=UPI0026196276|nr:peptidylprolyl isomerase [uncultured Neptuniibacter sp.]